MAIAWTSFWTRIWYGLTQYFTHFKGTRLPRFTDPNEISQLMQRGNRYRPDRRAGAMTHPKKVNRRIEAGELIGDCEDHAGVWIHGIITSGLADEVYMGHVFYTKDNGKKEGHAVAVYLRNGEWFWADYYNPTRVAHRDDWVPSVLKSMGGTLRGGYLQRATLGRTGNVRFGKTTLYRLQ